MSNQTKVAPKLSSDVQAKVDAAQTVSEKIRVLDRAKMSRGDIARTLGKRYQHVRNVLEGDKLAKANKGK